jgi:hypothetical protein
MTLHLQIHHDACGTWSVHGLSREPATGLPGLSASIDYARRECGEAPATIELRVDGLYLVVHQENGWPRQFVVPETGPHRQTSREGAGGGDRPLVRLRDWLSGQDK